jgi:aromatic-L-amino-acid decarboxylase
MLGLEGIQARLRSHLELCQNFADFIQQHEQLELCFGPILNTCGFALDASDFTSLEACNAQTKSLMEAINARGTAYLSHTVYKNRYIIRAVFGQTYLDSRHVKVLMEVVNKELQALTRI